MTRLLDLLENFEDLPAPQQRAEPEADSAALETARLAAFDKGYRAGWDDAVAAHHSEQGAIRADLAQNLRDLSFTYNEALAHAVGSVLPIMGDVLDKVLPEAVRQTIGQHIAEQLNATIRQGASGPVEIRVNPAELPGVASILDADFGFPVRVLGDDGLAPGQADLRFAQSETRIDLAQVVQDITAAIAAFASELEREKTIANAR